MAKTQDNKKSAAKVKRPSPLKRAEQAAKKQVKNRAVKSQIRTARRAVTAVDPKDEALKATTLSDAYSVLDKAVKKGVIKPNNASRLKSRLAAKTAA